MDKYYIRNMTARSIVNSVGADDSDVRLVIRYVGSSASCLITTAGNNTIASAVGALGSEAADTNFTVGATPGTIDLTNAAANTMGEVVDFINGLADYEAYLVGALRADDADTVGALVAVTSQQAKTAQGLALKGDSSVSDNITLVISSRGNNDGTGLGLVKPGVGIGFEREGAINTLYRLITDVTFTGADTTSFYSINDNGTETLLFTRDYLTSTTEADINFLYGAGSGGGLEALPGERLLVRVAAATTMAIDTNVTLIGSTKSF